MLLFDGGVPYVTNMFQINAVRVLITTVTIVVILICTTLSHLHMLCSIMSYFPVLRLCMQSVPARVGERCMALGVRGTHGVAGLALNSIQFLARLVRSIRSGRRNVPRFFILSKVLSFFKKDQNLCKAIAVHAVNRQGGVDIKLHLFSNMVLGGGSGLLPVLASLALGVRDASTYYIARHWASEPLWRLR